MQVCHPERRHRRRRDRQLFCTALAAARALEVPRTSVHQSPHTPIVSFRTDPRPLRSVRNLPAFEFGFALEVSAGAPPAGVAGGSHLPLCEVKTRGHATLARNDRCASAVPRDSTDQPPLTPIVSFRTDPRPLRSVRNLPAFEFGFALEVSAGAPPAGLAGGSHLPLCEVKTRGRATHAPKSTGCHSEPDQRRVHRTRG
jgi:hypothetical protein